MEEIIIKLSFINTKAQIIQCNVLYFSLLLLLCYTKEIVKLKRKKNEKKKLRKMNYTIDESLRYLKTGGHTGKKNIVY